jgi:hypothetical protein
VAHPPEAAQRTPYLVASVVSVKQSLPFGLEAALAEGVAEAAEKPGEEA